MGVANFSNAAMFDFAVYISYMLLDALLIAHTTLLSNNLSQGGLGATKIVIQPTSAASQSIPSNIIIKLVHI